MDSARSESATRTKRRGSDPSQTQLFPLAIKCAQVDPEDLGGFFETGRIVEDQADVFPALLQAKEGSLKTIQSQGKPKDDIKSAAGLIYAEVKRLLELTEVGNDAKSFARNVLAPLVTSDKKTYQELRQAVFGQWLA